MQNTPRRRDFLKLSAVAFAGAGLNGSLAAAGNSANDKLVVGVIGCGGRGRHDAGLFKNTPNVEVAWVCDVDDGRRQKAAHDLGVAKGKAAADLRRVLDNKAVDAVIVTTPDHWHSPASILACDAGKHVYVEKPISHNIREGRLLVEAADRNKKLVQHGTQVRSTSMIAQAVERLHAGIIGTVLVAKCWNIQRRGTIGHLWSTSFPYNVDSRAEFYGTDGQMFLSRRGKIEVRSARNAKVELDIKPEPQNDVAHVRNFCEAIRGGTKLNADALTGHLTSSLCHLGNIATRLGRALVFNPNTEQIVGDDEANALVRREYREHWGRPHGET